MPHPLMFDDDDPHLAVLRRLALAFPGTDERVSHGRPTFRTRVAFAVYGGPDRTSDGRVGVQRPHAVLVKVDETEQRALDDDPRFFVPAYYGPYGWRGIDLDAAEPDWREIAELVDASYREVSGPRLVGQLDAAGSPAAWFTG
ncbi:phosphoribosylglycinamide formyltransferase [Beutenbergia cavernae DSM 12333]|uniref:Phosphoribosylglycinamide formyltransferase n=1 Tax=Beutenbergia cavernae (strain ATCC BAA-8 / DSM 12333 / CCUG 43141 / JCM 11478 / NBRC 16432 / NCIMB 13614 / HKI 0122) TaxID=471853 RepID=C5C023_BEUC1|nr:MmcQ/YjbR family DNA-binding protein [Beutenbergia cavernae]ACQ79209.1 phosphoribosylglycinamide formyltransferase [Beutenbergia cavernae DSM 12333]